MSTFTIDFFELMLLAESVIPPRPIGRAMCFDDFSNKHYHYMTEEQRIQFLNHIKSCIGFSLDNEQCRHFVARFEPYNQYMVSYSINGIERKTECYLYENEYRISKNTFINPDYIISAIKIL
jgi:hypothetical protein